MGIFDILTGKVNALNTVLKPATQIFLLISNTFPEKDFFRDYFVKLHFSSYAFCQMYFELNIEPNILKNHIKNITEDKANKLMKLIAIHHSLTFLSNKENTYFIGQLNITPEILIEYLITSLQMTESDLDMFKNLHCWFNDNHSSYLVGWVQYFNKLVLGQNNDNNINVDTVIITGQILKDSYTILIDLFNKKI